MDLEGRLIQKLAVQSGSSQKGEWAKQEFVIEYKDGNYPQNACFSVWGQDKVRDLEKFNVNDNVKVSFNIASREYNGRWFTDLRAWRIAPVVPQGTEGGPAGGYSAQDIPAGFAPKSNEVIDLDLGSTDVSSDDLPF